jgi:hypothetical protein
MFSQENGLEHKTQNAVCVIHYKWIGGIGLKDHLLQMYLIERKRMHKWYVKLFRSLPNATVLNAMMIYKHNTIKQIDQLAFRITLVEALFQQFAGAEFNWVAGLQKISFHN